MAILMGARAMLFGQRGDSRRTMRHTRHIRRASCAVAAVSFCALSTRYFQDGSTAWIPNFGGEPLGAAARGSDTGAAVSQRRTALLGGLAAATVQASPAEALSPQERQAISLFSKSSGSVLGITATPPNGNEEPRIAGSGWVWDDHHVVTNFHVIKEAATPMVTFVAEDGLGDTARATVPTQLVGADPLSDIAVLRVGPRVADAALPRPLARGNSSELVVGQQVYALGNPFGLERSMSRGIISGVSRSLEGIGGRPINGVIQTDASINPGNSGGPLLDSTGQVIGMNTAILTTSGSFAGVGLAIPISMVEKNVQSMLSQGYVKRPSLGIVFAPDAILEQTGMDSGAMVLRVLPDSPAQKAGVHPMKAGRWGDVIVGFGGRPVANVDELFKLLDNRSPGEDVNVVVRRSDADTDRESWAYIYLKMRLGAAKPPVQIM